MSNSEPYGTPYPPPPSTYGVPDYAPGYAPPTTPIAAPYGGDAAQWASESNPVPPTGTPSGASSESPSTTDVAKEQAANIAGGAADAAKDVAGTVKEQTSQVTAEASQQVKNLLGQARSELTEQAGTQQQRLAGGLRDLGDQLRSMADGSDNQGVATDVAHQAAERAHQLAGWFEDRDPGSVLAEVRSFARQRPGAFLALALGAGLVAGRLARNLAADPDELAAENSVGAKNSVGSKNGAGSNDIHAQDARVGSASNDGALGHAQAAELPSGYSDPAVNAYGSAATNDWTGKTAAERESL